MKEFFQFVSGRDFSAEGGGLNEAALSDGELLDAYSQATGVPTLFNQVRSAAGDALENTANYPAGTRALG